MSGFIKFSSLEEVPIVDNLIDRACSVIQGNPKTIAPFKLTSPKRFKEFYRSAVCQRNSPYILVAFYDVVTPDPRVDEAVGLCFMCLGEAWYLPEGANSTLTELCTVSFKKGSGIVRRVVTLMRAYAKEHNIRIIGGACANKCCARAMGNAYRKLGFTSYRTYYKVL